MALYDVLTDGSYFTGTMPYEWKVQFASYGLGIGAPLLGVSSVLLYLFFPRKNSNP